MVQPGGQIARDLKRERTNGRVARTEDLVG
jgi:hypothetical protein